MLGAAGITHGVHAQVLPVPGARNADWALEKTEQRRTGQAATLLGSDRMPNAGQGSIASIGNRNYQWDANRQLAYEWLSRSGSPAPADLVAVRDDRTGTVYTYRRQAPAKASRQWHRLLAPAK